MLVSYNFIDISSTDRQNVYEKSENKFINLIKHIYRTNILSTQKYEIIYLFILKAIYFDHKTNSGGKASFIGG